MIGLEIISQGSNLFNKIVSTKSDHCNTTFSFFTANNTSVTLIYQSVFTTKFSFGKLRYWMCENSDNKRGL